MSAVLGGLRFVAATPRAWPLAVVPIALLITLLGIGGWIAFHYMGPWMVSLLPETSSRWTGLGVRVVGWIATGLALLAAALLALALTPPLSGPALEQLVRLREESLAVAARSPLGFVQEILCGFRSQVAAALVGLPILALLWGLALLVPPSALIVIPLQYTVVGLMAAWNLLDYPLTLRAISVRRRVQLLRRDWTAALGFGLGFSLVFAVPCFGILMLPAAVSGATELAAKLGWLGPPVPSGQRSSAPPS